MCCCKIENIKNLYKEIKSKFKFIKNKIIKYYNIKRIKRLTFKEGEIVYLLIKNIIIKRLIYKLDFKYIRPYKIL